MVLGEKDAAMTWRLKSVLYITFAMAALNLHAGEHVVPLDTKIDSAKCLECHEDKNKAPHVHSAIAMGCDVCHQVKNEKDVTIVELVAPKNELCFTCHEKAKGTTVHGPYSEGKCVLCHDPHASEFENQLRAKGNTLCLECHQDRSISGKLALFKTPHELTEEEFESIPKIGLDPTLTMGHPLGMHKVSGIPDALRPDKKMSCLSCHENHASDREKLVRTVEVSGKKMDACDACHLANDNARMAAAQKRTDEQTAERDKEQQLQSKQPSVMPERAPRTKTKGKQP
jgi:predicted CXXCH cytochrome family protein